MRRVLAWLMGMSCACGSVSSSAQTTTLEDVVRLALTRNERSRVADLTVVTADAAVSRARAGFLPTIVAGGSETFRPFPPDTNGRATNAVRSATANGTLTITQPIVSVPAFPLYSAAKSAREAARFDALNQRRQLSFDAARPSLGPLRSRGC